MLKAPRFWSQPPGVYSTLCTPLAQLYSLGHLVKTRVTSTQAVHTPVICVGNFTVGGAGKTPTVLALIRLLEHWGKGEVHVLTRGYGGSLQQPTLVNPQVHNPREVGDEALLLAQVAKTWVGQDRFKTARCAEQQGAKMLIMDDGAQNPRLQKDLCLMVVDGAQGIGNGRVLPAGPLREPFGQGLHRAQAVVVIGDDQHHVTRSCSQPVFKAHIEPLEQSIEEISGQKIVAFAGIGLPDKFFKTLQEHNADVIEMVSFPDHHPYKEKDLRPLLEIAQKHNALLVTTEKDYLRVPPALQPSIKPFKIHLVFDSKSKLQQLLNAYID